MLILGLLLAVAALVVFGFMYFGTTDLNPLEIDLGIISVQLTPLHLYLLGAATLVVLVLGLFFLTLGLRTSRRRRREVKELRAAVQDGDTTPLQDRQRRGGDRERAGGQERAPVDRVVAPTPRDPGSAPTDPPSERGPGTSRPGSTPGDGGPAAPGTGPTSPDRRD